MKIHRVFLLIFLVSCASPQTVIPVLEFTSTIQPSPEPTLTFIPPTRTATVPPAITAADTPVPCDPFTAGFCITAGHFIFQRPIRTPGGDSVDRTYPYASTAKGTRDPHHGVEFDADFGTPVHAAADGIILFAGPDEVAIYSPWKNYYGNLVVIQHEGKLFTLYAHLSKIDVEAGKPVRAGDQIGEVGQSGVATGSHLHFEVRREPAEDFYATVNPELWLLPREKGFGALSVSLIDEGALAQAAVTLQRYSASGIPVESYYYDTYHASLVGREENAGMGDLPAGRYRITLLYNSHLYEKWVEVESGRLTQAVIVVE